MTNKTSKPSDVSGKETINRFKKFVKDYGFTYNQMASKMGLFPNDLEKMMSGEVAYNPENPDWIKVIEFLNEMDNKIYPTKLLRVTHRVLNACYREKEIAVLTGRSGAGKTEACMQYCLTNHDAVFIRVIEVCSTKYLLMQMLRGLGASPTGLSKTQLFEAIAGMLKTRHKIFIIDEAERLDVGQLEMLRDFFDKKEIFDEKTAGLCFVGLPKLRNLLQSGRSLKEDLVQLYSRIIYNEEVDILEPQDVRMIIDDKLPRNVISDDKVKKLSHNYKEKGGIRAILKICSLMNKLMDKNKDKFSKVNDILVDHAIEKLKL